MPWTKPQPHGSFAPVRRNTRARWLVDGFRTFEAMADALEAATAEIMIAGWWVAPDLVLRRQTGADSRSVARVAAECLQPSLLLMFPACEAVPAGGSYVRC